MTDEELDEIERLAQWRSTGLTEEVLSLVAEIRRLRGMVHWLADRVAAQSELLSQRAESWPGQPN